MGHWHLISLLGLLGATPGCIVPSPRPQQLAGYELGFSTPEGAFESLRTAFQGEVLEWELRCFSHGFRARNQLSQQAYRAFRPELLEQIPHLRWGLSRAVVETVEELSPGRARLVARIPVPLLQDMHLAVELVREEYAELFMGAWDVASSEPLDGALRVDDSKPGAFGEGLVWVRLDATTAVTQEQLREGFTRLKGAREWKVDAIEVVEP